MARFQVDPVRVFDSLIKEKAPESRRDKLTTMLGDRPVHVVLPHQHWLHIYININVDFLLVFSNIRLDVCVRPVSYTLVLDVLPINR